MAKIIHLVGTSGSGKSTVHSSLNNKLREDGFEVKELKEPGLLGDFAKNYRRRNDKSPLIEAAIFSTDRLLLYDKEVFHRMNEQNLIFSFDRGLPDTIVYQGLLGGVDIELIKEMNKHIPQSDLCLVLIVDGAIGHARAVNRFNETGEEPSKNEAPRAINILADHYRTLSSYLPNVKIIDTSHLSKEQVLNECYKNVQEALYGRKN